MPDSHVPIRMVRNFPELAMDITHIFFPSSPKWIRGAVVATYQWAITIGLLIAAVVNDATKDMSGAKSYQIPIAIQFVWAGVLAAGMMFLPESPRWLIKRGNHESAAHSLGRLTGLPSTDPAVQAELNEITANLEAERSLGESSYADCFKFNHNKIAWRTLTGIAIQG
jgi:MFS transporter, SP family, sugar:H+ symporter